MNDIDPGKVLGSLRFYDHGYCSTQSVGHRSLAVVIASIYQSEVNKLGAVTGMDERGVQFFTSLVHRDSTNQLSFDINGEQVFPDADQLELGLSFKAEDVGLAFWHCRDATVAARLRLNVGVRQTGFTDEGRAVLLDHTCDNIEEITVSESITSADIEIANWLTVTMTDLEVEISGDRLCRGRARTLIEGKIREEIEDLLPFALEDELVRRFVSIPPAMLGLPEHSCRCDVDCSPHSPGGPAWPGAVWGSCSGATDDRLGTCRVHRFPTRVVLGPTNFEFVLAESNGGRQVQLSTSEECSPTRRNMLRDPASVTKRAQRWALRHGV